MLLCANKSDGTVDFLKPPTGSAPGDIIKIGDFDNSNPDEVLHPKKNPWDKVKDNIFINDSGEAVFDKKDNWRTTKGDITCLSMKGGVIS
jgi:hypothetical protein